MSASFLTSFEEKDIRNFLVLIFGRQAKEWKINNRVVELTTKAFNESIKCSKRLDAAPRPVGFTPSGLSVASQAVSIARRVLNNKGQYQICIDYIAYHYKSAIYMAANNI